MDNNLGDIMGSLFKKASDLIGNSMNTANNNSDENNSIEFVDPKNPVDPVVVFDPEFEFSSIVLPYNEEDTNKVNATGDDINTLNVNGIMVPIIKLNNKIILPKDMYSLVIRVKDFLPTISLTVNDAYKNIQATDVPGMNNVITVILIAPVDGANKKMSMDFYITDCVFNIDNTVTYSGEFKFNGLQQVKYTQVGDDKLSTYELLEKIAKELKLGFAASEKCKDINDKRWRQIYSKTYINYIKQELGYGGVDENSIFDAWIDNFGYLVLVNISHIMNIGIDPKQLSIKVIEGATVTLPDNAVPKQNVEEVYRIITNSEESGSKHNLYFNNYNSIVNNNLIKDKGNSNKYYYLSSPGEDNTIAIKDLTVFENSVDGIKGIDDYKYENIEFIGTFQTDDDEETCKIFQKQIVENFFNKLHSKILKVELENANYSLQRGMLLTLLIEEYDIANKQFIEENNKNVVSDGEEEDSSEKTALSANERNNISNDEIGILNPSLSGLYYIDGIEFNYYHGEQRIGQTLYLIRKGIQNNLTNKYTDIRV